MKLTRLALPAASSEAQIWKRVVNSNHRARTPKTPRITCSASKHEDNDMKHGLQTKPFAKWKKSSSLGMCANVLRLCDGTWLGIHAYLAMLPYMLSTPKHQKH
eukprot:4055186-Amphidinium_carterae.1